MNRGVLVYAVLLAAQGCGSPESRIAHRLSTLSTSADQKRLWQQAADQNQAVGVARVDQSGQPVQSRQPPSVTNQAIQPQGTGILAASVTTGVRILATTGLQNEYLGQATVAAINSNGEQLQLDLGNGRSVTLQARANQKPLSLQVGFSVGIEYRVRNEPSSPQQVFALRAPNGTGVARIKETGSMPIAVTVPLFLLEASQQAAVITGSANVRPAVNVRVGAAQQTVTSAQPVQIGGLTVTVISRGPSGTPVDKRIEGGPYGLELTAWR